MHWICIPNRHKEMAPFFFLCLSNFSVERRSSYPYITGDTWRFFCDKLLTENESFDPKEVKRGDSIFVEYQLLDKFQKLASRIKQPYILITPNVENYSDNPLPGPFIKLLKKRNLAAWFLQNIDCEATDKLIPIPIGLANDFWKSGQFEAKTRERDILAYLNFNLDTNPKERRPCLEYFSKWPWAQRSEPKTFHEYLDDLSRSLFVVSPPGSGLDCHRTWEALLMGCYPIVLSSTLNPLYEDLPVVIVDSWEEVTEALLEKKREEFQNRNLNYSKIYIPYWFEKVSHIQNQLRDPTV
ncbi:MAG: hypothetical protein K1X28_10860 [Parachlamydiales bacterium]|nr:hypothetical protein [Parachlamydiales bacterium]